MKLLNKGIDEIRVDKNQKTYNYSIIVVINGICYHKVDNNEQ